jgi:hypothetical protein
MQDASKLKKRYTSSKADIQQPGCAALFEDCLFFTKFSSQALSLLSKFHHGLSHCLKFKGDSGEQNGSLRFEITWTSSVSEDWPNIHLG